MNTKLTRNGPCGGDIRPPVVLMIKVYISGAAANNPTLSSTHYPIRLLVAPPRFGSERVSGTESAAEKKRGGAGELHQKIGRGSLLP